VTELVTMLVCGLRGHPWRTVDAVPVRHPSGWHTRVVQGCDRCPRSRIRWQPGRWTLAELEGVGR